MTDKLFNRASRELDKVTAREEEKMQGAEHPDRQLVTIEHRGNPREHDWSTQKTYDATNLYCPACGRRSVWVEWGEGDYYVGPENVCAECGAEFTYQGPEGQVDHRNDPVAEQLRTRTTAPPKHKIGR